MTYWKTLYLSFFYFSISLFASNLDVFNKTARHMKFVLQLWYLVKLNGLIKVEKAWLKNTNLVLVTCVTNAWLSKASFQNMLRRIFFLNFPGERVNQYLPCSYCLICTQKSRYISSPISGWELGIGHKGILICHVIDLRLLAFLIDRLALGWAFSYPIKNTYAMELFSSRSCLC